MIVRLGLLVGASIAAYTVRQINVKGPKPSKSSVKHTGTSVLDRILLVNLSPVRRISIWIEVALLLKILCNYVTNHLQICNTDNDEAVTEHNQEQQEEEILDFSNISSDGKVMVAIYNK